MKKEMKYYDMLMYLDTEKEKLFKKYNGFINVGFGGANLYPLYDPQTHRKIIGIICETPYIKSEKNEDIEKYINFTKDLYELKKETETFLVGTTITYGE